MNQVLPPDTGKGVLKESGPAKTIPLAIRVLTLAPESLRDHW